MFAVIHYRVPRFATHLGEASFAFPTGGSLY